MVNERERLRERESQYIFNLQTYSHTEKYPKSKRQCSPLKMRILYYIRCAFRQTYIILLFLIFFGGVCVRETLYKYCRNIDQKKTFTFDGIFTHVFIHGVLYTFYLHAFIEYEWIYMLRKYIK